MSMKTRTVAAFVILGILIGSIATFLTFDALDKSIFAQDEWKQPSASQEPVGQNGKALKAVLPGTEHMTDKQLKKLENAYELVQSNYYEPVDAEKIIDGAIEGMMNALEDPYTVYMDAEAAKQFNDTIIESSFSGIGAEVTMDQGKVTVVAPIKGSPAERSGIRARDVILSVNGEQLDGLNLNEAVLKIRGPKGSQAKLEVLRGDTNQKMEIIVVRDDIDIETVYAEMLSDHIGKIEIRQVAQNTSAHFKEALSELESQGMKSLVIDARNNPGGILQVVIDLLHPLVPKGKAIVQVEDRDGRIERQLSQGPGKDYPIVVLTNKGSASAAEILAAALKESAGAVIVGESTFGKGLVQSTYDSGVGDGSSIKMTIAKWLTPDGNFIHNEGVKPDIEVALPDYFKSAPIAKDKVLREDEVGAKVENLQMILKGLQLNPGRDDGYFDEGTVEAVMNFQKAHQLTASGQVDEETAVLMENELIELMLNPQNDTQLQKAIQILTQKQSSAR